MTKEYDFEATLEEMTSPSTFDLKAALAKKTAPEDKVTVFLDGKTMHEANVLTDGVLDTESELNTYKNARNAELAGLLTKQLELSAESSGGITDDPEKEVVDKQIIKHRKDTAAGVKKIETTLKKQEAEIERLLGVVKESALTFKLRGLAPKQSELIVAKWEREHKEPARGDYENETDFLLAYNTAMRKRNRGIVIDQVRTSIVSVTGSDLVEHAGGWKYEQGVELWDEIDDSERTKLNTMTGNLTFANTLYSRVATEDADFLAKP